ncbi:cytoplasmic dynein 2 intermediate chain 1-like, partial [Ornithodoros turicata]|uniref:cytoplasmic dynein 2 intermediate chain 1-like n=1 Tax=Ornithodoros turicata TaxID=34597 RepID=UPI0031386C4B
MSAVFAGMADGSLAIWDLRGRYSLHKSLIVTSRLPHREWQLKLPSYSTASVLGSDNHFSPVVSVQSPVQSTRELSLQGFSETSESFIVLSLDEDGVIIVWTVVETNSNPAGSDDDLGIAPFGRLRLLRSSTIQLQNAIPVAGPHLDVLRTFDMQVSPIQRTHIFVATNLGLVLHCARHGGSVSPKYYKSRHEETIAQVNCIAFSPHNLPFFLVGCSNGSLRLHSTHCETSLMEWQSPTEEPVHSVQWSPSDPTKFFSVGSDG